MARKLPWLADGPKKPSVSKLGNQSSSPKPAKRKRLIKPAEEDNELSASDNDVSTSKRKMQEPNARHPSSSTPPSPPKPQPMIEGYSADDIWVMVEDEFYATAKKFTQHLHHLEYRRLKKQAASQNASTIHKISRPVDGKTQMSTETKLKIRSTEQRHKINNAITNMGGNGRDDKQESEDDDPWMNDPRLAGLMTEKERPPTKLTEFVGVKSRSKASQGYSGGGPSQASQLESSARNFTIAEREKSRLSKPLRTTEESDYEAEDLDANPEPSRPTKMSYSRSRTAPVEKPISNPLRDLERSERAGTIPYKSREETKSQLPISPAKKISASSRPSIQAPSDALFDDFSDVPKRQPSSFAERMAKRRAEAAKREKEKEKEEPRRISEQFDAIPTFLV
ncbi:hypothetical protein EJ08DRAFT_650870 [Tothia fuscella]|uniref:Uncharacterized protein n=1 Tax=Tothia fuscella TaxID=1048955 RepID=A0A9P4NNR4_9PEZI|nr:hypothetical protein EJ08DRAFT_650870 [Tothia fuscella]